MPRIPFKSRRHSGRQPVERNHSQDALRVSEERLSLAARAEERLRRLNRTHAVLSGINQVIVRERALQPLLERACQVAVDKGGFKLAWIGLAHGSDCQMQVRADAGATPETHDLLVDMFRDPRQGCEFTAHALQTGEHAVCNDIASDPRAAPWREAALTRGYLSMTSLPLKIAERPVGALNLYAPERGFFDWEEMTLLDALAADVSFALEAYERERERARALAQLQASEERLRDLTDTIEDVFFITSATREEVLYISPAYEKIWGRPCAALVANPHEWLEAVHPEDRERVHRGLQIVDAGGSFNDEYRIVRPDGSVRWIRDQFYPIRNGARIDRLVGVARDITERKQLAEQVRQAQKMEAIGQLAGGIAHDFNNLIGTIVGNAELARMDIAVGHPAQESIREISRAGKRAKELVNRLLTFGRPSEQQLKPIQLAPVVGEAVTLLRAMLPAGIELTLFSSPELPTVRADASQIHQIVMNLVTNSWHAIERDTGRIALTLERCSIDAHSPRLSAELKSGLYVRLSIIDTGRGMDAATLERIFEPFFTTKPAGLGSGLGLAVVHGIVRSHGGAIEVESEPGRGAAFRLYFPATQERAHVEPSSGKAASAGGGQHVLFVDDEEPLVSLASRLLTRAGYRVSAYSSAAAALAAYAAAPYAFDLVITDHNMPEMSGIELARRMRERRPDALIVLASGYLPQAEIERARAQGVREVIGKPGAVEDLARIAARLLSGPTD